MKTLKQFSLSLLLAAVSLLYGVAQAQVTPPQVTYRITYTPSDFKYHVFVVPEYNAANVKSATAQVTIRVPKVFEVDQANVANAKGVWVFDTLNGANFGALSANYDYYVFGKSSEETDFGSFVSGTPVELFSFTGNSCAGVISVVGNGQNAANTFNAEDAEFLAAAETANLNVKNSFYSTAGQPAYDAGTNSGNQEPVEQFRDKSGDDADCRVDLMLVKSVDNETPDVETDVTFTIEVKNLGLGTATGVQVRDTLTQGFTYVSSVLKGTDTYDPQTGIWTINKPLPKDSSAILKIVATVNPNKAGFYLNYTEVIASDILDKNSTPDNGPQNPDENDDDTLTLEPQALADLAINKEINNYTPEVGEEVTFSLKVINLGPSTATDIDVTDALPNGYSFVANSFSTTAVYDAVAKTITWDPGTLAKDGEATLTFKATVNEKPQTPTTNYYKNFATLVMDGPVDDPEPDNNIDSVAIQELQLLAKVNLQGALFGVTDPNGLMRDSLRTLADFPKTTATSPYASLNPTYTAATVTNTFSADLTATGSNAIVDWVFVELRDRNDSTRIVSSRSALLQRDGDIVALDGVSPLDIRGIQDSTYYVAVRHRNHLGVMTALPVGLTTAGTEVDFRNANTPTYVKASNNPIHQSQVVVAQGRALWAGNTEGDGDVIYQGTTNDVQTVSTLINAAQGALKYPHYVLKAYANGDVNMDGRVIFQGTRNDVEFIYLNISRNHSGNENKDKNFVIQQQLPE